ncbi:MAG: leucine--tRNA ligase [Pyrodictiaceae archaeon]
MRHRLRIPGGGRRTQYFLNVSKTRIQFKGCCTIVEEASRTISIAPRAKRELVEKLKAIEAKWQERWMRDKIFEADPDPTRPKFFVTFPYPYVNGLPHLGSAFTILRVDITARYKRMRGYNVLFPQGWHATGGPIVSAALRVREGDETIIRMLKSMGVREDEIPFFREPAHWVKYFTKQWRKDLERYGMSIDWRREFFTTSLNPYYSKFVEWQYYKLREKGLVGKGSHPVVWCPKEKKVVGDHDRLSGYEGIGPIEAYIIKFRSEKGLILPALTLRPETIYGVTNIWVNPDYEYVIAMVDGEKWVLTDYMVGELADQDHVVEVAGRVRGAELIGMMVENPVTGERIPVLPASFVKTNIGTGVVMSVPAHAPYDYIALLELKKKPWILEKYGLDRVILDKLKPVKIIDVPGVKELLVEKVTRELGISSQRETDKLEKATREVYSREFYRGVMAENTGKWKGKPVKEAKEEIAKWLVEEGYAVKIYTLPREVYCRCGAQTHVKIVKNQWFILYSKPEWKKLARKALAKMRLYPEEARSYFEEVIENLKDWAFTHQKELGTPLPWDPDWVIESLSDSTIYMAYYTIAKYLQHPEKYGIRPEQLTPEVFDYIFYGRGDPDKISMKTGIDRSLLEEMRREFDYWYPVDVRISGKDLIPNHLTFFIFHHVALFPEDKWPRAIGVNGWVLIGGERMSKSRGNFILLRQALDWWGADATRWAEVLGGADASLDDANFEPSQADAAVTELLSWLEFVKENYNNTEGVDEWRLIDKWFESVLHETIKKVTNYMEEEMYRSALVEAYYNLMSKYKWYIRRAGKPNKKLLREFIEVQIRLIAPFAPHIAEEAWESIGKKPYVSLAPWPSYDEAKIDRALEDAENVVREALEDAEEIIRLKGKAKRLHITVAAEWKYKIMEKMQELIMKGMGAREALQAALRDVEAPKRELQNFIQRLLKNLTLLERRLNRNLEYEMLRDAKELFRRELGLEEIIVEFEEESKSPRRHLAMPGRPALYFEY